MPATHSIGESLSLQHKIRPNRHADIFPVRLFPHVQQRLFSVPHTRGKLFHDVMRVAEVVADNGSMKKDQAIRAALASCELDDFFRAAKNAPERFAVAALTAEDRDLFACKGDTLCLSRHSPFVSLITVLPKTAKAF